MPLNPPLYAAMQREFKNVRIVNEGVSIQYEEVRRRREDNRVYVDRDIRLRGEEYQANCPFCSDTHMRMSVNHTWGVYDHDTGLTNTTMWKCYNEECQQDLRNRDGLFYMLTLGNGYSKDDVQKGSIAPEILEPEWPGPMVNLAKLAQKKPDHSAIRYIQNSRKFDPTYLGNVFDARYCISSDQYPLAERRIILPVYTSGELMGWQARYIGDDVGGRSFKEARLPKYYTMPGMQKGRSAFNYDNAVRHSTIVLTEGPLDVARIGPYAMGLMGKTLSGAMVDKLNKHLRYYPDTCIVIMLDPEMDEKEIKKGKPHPIEKIANVFESFGHRQVVRVYLPEGTDPGDTCWTSKSLRKRMKAAAKDQGVEIAFRRPRRSNQYEKEASVSAATNTRPRITRPGSAARGGRDVWR